MNDLFHILVCCQAMEATFKQSKELGNFVYSQFFLFLFFSFFTVRSRYNGHFFLLLLQPRLENKVFYTRIATYLACKGSISFHSPSSPLFVHSSSWHNWRLNLSRCANFTTSWFKVSSFLKHGITPNLGSRQPQPGTYTALKQDGMKIKGQRVICSTNHYSQDNCNRKKLAALPAPSFLMK